MESEVEREIRALPLAREALRAQHASRRRFMGVRVAARDAAKPAGEDAGGPRAG